MNALELRRALDQVVQGVTEGNLGILDEGVSAMEAGIKQQQGIIEALVAACEALIQEADQYADDLLVWLLDYDNWEDVHPKILPAMRAAIAKARGEVRS